MAGGQDSSVKNRASGGGQDIDETTKAKSDAGPASTRKIIRILSVEVKSAPCFGGAATGHMRQNDEGRTENIGKLRGSHRLDSSGGKWLFHKRHGSERFCQGDDPSRCPRVHRRSMQM